MRLTFTTAILLFGCVDSVGDPDTSTGSHALGPAAVPTCKLDIAFTSLTVVHSDDPDVAEGNLEIAGDVTVEDVTFTFADYWSEFFGSNFALELSEGQSQTFDHYMKTVTIPAPGFAAIEIGAMFAETDPKLNDPIFGGYYDEDEFGMFRNYVLVQCGTAPVVIDREANFCGWSRARLDASDYDCSGGSRLRFTFTVTPTPNEPAYTGPASSPSTQTMTDLPQNNLLGYLAGLAPDEYIIRVGLHSLENYSLGADLELRMDLGPFALRWPQAPGAATLPHGTTSSGRLFGYYRVRGADVATLTSHARLPASPDFHDWRRREIPLSGQRTTTIREGMLLPTDGIIDPGAIGGIPPELYDGTLTLTFQNLGVPACDSVSCASDSSLLMGKNELGQLYSYVNHAPLVAVYTVEPFLEEARDRDGDAYLAATDCDDRDPTVHPWAVDVCDGKDNDCDGVIDEGFGDLDSDGIPDCRDSDSDNDGFPNAADNCPLVKTATQADQDKDGIGDACDPCPADANNDKDHDGVCGNVDNCPDNWNRGQANMDGDAWGDVCDIDSDNDGIKNSQDLCPLRVTTLAEKDTDKDGVGDSCDNCKLLPNPGQSDTDHDNIGDACDTDWDNDGVPNVQDNCPLLSNPNQEPDHDGSCKSTDVMRVVRGLIVQDERLVGIIAPLGLFLDPKLTGVEPATLPTLRSLGLITDINGRAQVNMAAAVEYIAKVPFGYGFADVMRTTKPHD